METIKEAAGKCGGCRLSCLTECETFETNDEKTACCNRLERRGFIQGVAWAERWIPVEEELPQLPNKETFDVEHDYNQVLVKNKGYSVRTANVYHEEDILWIKTNFTHWRPIIHE